MNDKRRKGALGADILGIVLVIGGAALALLMIMAMIKGLPQEGATGTGKVARRVILAFGYAPAFLLSLGIAAVGVRVYLGGLYDRMPRDLSGLLGTSAGLAILLGAFSQTAGGGLGDATGGFLARYLTTIPAVILGLAAVAAPVWLTWLREFSVPGSRERRVDPLLAVAREGRKETAPEAGVSLQEAEALLPEGDEADPESVAQYEVEEILAGGTPDWVSHDESQNPYPADPRLEGKIPAGAVPLQTQDDPADPRSGGDASSTSRWTPSRESRSEKPADEDLAVGEFRPRESVETPDPESAGDTGDRAGLAGATGSDSLSEASEPGAGEAGISVLRIDNGAPRPSWESEASEASKSDESDETTEEPAQTVATEQQGSSHTWHPSSASEADAEDEDEDGDWEYEDVAELEDDELEDVEEEEDGESPDVAAELDEEDECEEVEDEEDDDESSDVAAELDEDEYEEVEEEDDDESPDVAAELDEEECEEVEEEEDAETPATAAELEEDSEEEEEDEEEYEYIEVAEGEELPGEDDEWEYEYVEVDDDDDEEELVAEAVEVPGEPETEAPELAQVAPGDEAASVEEVREPPLADPEAVAAAPADAPDTDVVQMDLFADPEEASAAQAEVPEPVVVLEPREPPAKLASDKAIQAADVILAESRVAVSLLQRKFGMDFKESCTVLDELQQLGFIGPYIDGKQRDILMDREEWLSAVGGE